MTGTGSPALLFPGDSVMATLMRAHDWASSPLGPPADWPPGLQIATRIALTSRFPMIIWWGPELRFLYNDAYLPMLGGKHPALDKPGAEVWADIWSIVGPMLDSVLETGQPTWSEDLLLPMARHAYWEETYWTYSYSPLLDDGGAVRGVFTAVTETTERVIGARRLAALQDLGAQAGAARTVAEACGLVSESLSRAQADVPYFALYLRDDSPARFTLASATRGAEAAAEPGRWPLARALAESRPLVVGDLAARPHQLPAGSWSEPPREAMVLPLYAAAETIGALVLAASAGHRLDDDYRTFMGLVARQTASLINGASAYQAQQRRAEDLAELDRAKTTFFSNISHEFRTPLTLIMGPVHELRSRLQDADPSIRGDLDMVHRNGLRLGKLVNALLDFSRIEAGRSHGHFEPADLATLTADLGSVFRAAFQRAGLGFEVDCPPLGEPAYVDREMWEKVVLNLLSNALKYTVAGSVRLSLTRSGGQAVLRVADTGSGISAEDMPHIFERFHRGSTPQARSNEGSGIGLALVKELVGLHGGRITVDSQPGAGATFTVSIPLGRGHLADDSVFPASEAVAPAGADPFLEEALRWLPAEPSARPAGGPGPVAAPAEAVLIADDNADMRDYLTRLLQSEYQITAVADGRAALAAARAERPDLIVSDVMMPGVDGLGLVQALRADPRTATVPVLLLSARAGQEAAVEGLQAGADDYLIKPFAADELLARARTAIDLTRMRSRQAQWRSALTESLQEGFFLASADGSLVEVNAAFRDMFGHGPGAPLHELPRLWRPDPRDDPDGGQIAAESYATTQRQPAGSFTVPLRHRDGHRIWAAVSFSAVEDPDGRGRMLVGTIRDVTAERLATERETAVAAMNSELAQAVTTDGVLAAGLAELRRQFGTARVLAAIWREEDEPPELISAPAGLYWDELPAPLRGTVERLRGQPPLQITTAPGRPAWAAGGAGQPAGAGTAVEYSGNVAAIWVDLDGRPPFGLEDRTLLALLCGCLGQALNREHLLDQEREVALALQHAMLGPARLPPGFAVRYEPATPPLEVGGDWYDIAELPDGQIGIIVGDCVGRGLAAATVMGQLRSACRALLLDAPGPAPALAALDRFATVIPDALCSTVFCAVLDPATGQLRYASAGHPPGILAHPDGRVEFLDQGRSLALALNPDHPRSEATAQIPEGATLLLYTDGLVERRGLDLDVTTRRAAGLLQADQQTPVAELAERIMTSLAPAQGYEDDVALLMYCRPAALSLSFRADPDELAPVRSRLRGWLSQLSMDPLIAQDVLIAACEACANAIEHGYHGSRTGTVWLRVEVAGPDIVITVSDRGRWREPREIRDRGHGLKLIRATMRDVAITANERGTTVEMRAGTS
ncbi:MAG TPA: SpoIIE family protein phosphatase [Streptosporangiaceae bacterium]|nr:SpoIIE family protein phosphatase [Streptosporangiaceae bacterium]